MICKRQISRPPPKWIPLEVNEQDWEKFRKKERSREKAVSKSYMLVMSLHVHWKTVGHDNNPKAHNDTKLLIKIGWNSRLKMVILLLIFENNFIFPRCNILCKVSKRSGEKLYLNETIYGSVGGLGKLKQNYFFLCLLLLLFLSSVINYLKHSQYFY